VEGPAFCQPHPERLSSDFPSECFMPTVWVVTPARHISGPCSCFHLHVILDGFDLRGVAHGDGA